jgi:hypothetical protein
MTKGPSPRWAEVKKDDGNFIRQAGEFFKEYEADFEYCPPGYLLQRMDVIVTSTPTFSGQYGPLPFEDPWWKVVLCVIVVVLLIAASIVNAASGGDLSISTGRPEPPPGDVRDCCRVRAEGGGSSYVAAALVAAAAAVATLAAYTDERDAFRRGQDNTVPLAGELTTKETVEMFMTYPEPITPGRPFSVRSQWKYTRSTTGSSYSYENSESNTNTHILSRYNIQAPNVIRTDIQERFIIRGQFFGPQEKAFGADQLFVQCILAGTGPLS